MTSATSGSLSPSQSDHQSVEIKPIDVLLRETAINSTTMYLLSFMVVFVIFYVANSIVGHYWDISNTLFYYGADFKEFRGNWSRSSVVTIYGVGPTICFFWAVFCFRMYFRTYKKPGLAKLFYVWGVVHGFVMFFGAAAVGVFTRSGFGYAIRWAYMPMIACFIIAALALVILLTVGIKFINFFMYTASSLALLGDKDSKKKFILYAVLIPFVVSSMLLIASQVPELFLANILLILSPILIVLPVWARVQSHHGSYGIAPAQSYGINKTWLIVALAILVGYRLFLASGIKIFDTKVDTQATEMREVKSNQ
jgi:hypothetical protein